jgi:hypothetical protein
VVAVRTPELSGLMGAASKARAAAARLHSGVVGVGGKTHVYWFSERRTVERLINSLIAGGVLAFAIALALFRTAHAHDRWYNGEPVPAWVKTVCCGPNDVHHLRPEQVSRNAAGDYEVDIYPFPIPARMALPSQDGEYWLFFYKDYGLDGMVRCFFVPALF